MATSGKASDLGPCAVRIVPAFPGISGSDSTCKAHSMATSGKASDLGPCAVRIAAAFPGISGSDSTNLVNVLNDVTFPGGAALALGQCDSDFCGDVVSEPTLQNVCVPYCSP